MKPSNTNIKHTAVAELRQKAINDIINTVDYVSQDDEDGRTYNDEQNHLRLLNEIRNRITGLSESALILLWVGVTSGMDYQCECGRIIKYNRRTEVSIDTRYLGV